MLIHPAPQKPRVILKMTVAEAQNCHNYGMPEKKESSFSARNHSTERQNSDNKEVNSPLSAMNRLEKGEKKKKRL